MQNNGSSFLLLILIGIAIYFLLNSDEGFISLKRKYGNEPFDNLIFNQSNNVPNNSDDNQYYSDDNQYYSDDNQYYSDDNQYYSDDNQYYSDDNDIYNSVDMPAMDMDNTNMASVQSNMASVQSDMASAQSNMASAQSNSSSMDSSIMPNIMDTLAMPLNSSTLNIDSIMPTNSVMSSEPNIPQSLINEIASSSAPVGGNNTTQIPSMFNFQPSDENIFDEFGSTLDSAFALPLPNNLSNDSVDFKKQNVDSFNAKDFLPKEVNDEWFETDFSLAKYQLNDDKLINTEKYIIGINTVGESLKNASHDLRGTIPNPKFITGPWNQSTIEPDFNLKPLC